jgi:cytochrome c
VEELQMVRGYRYITAAGILLALAAPASALDGNVDAGKKVFAKCAVCHGIGETTKPIGPNLNNVIGRTAGTQPEFLAKKGAGYSKAMIAAGEGGLVWDAAQIAEYITDPKKKVPGNKMAFPGLKKEQEIADVIAYVSTFSKP